MRLWHYKILPYIPNSQIKGQWRELNVIFKAGKERINHILINYVKDCSKADLKMYTYMVLHEMMIRKLNFVSLNPLREFFKMTDYSQEEILEEAFVIEHIYDYLKTPIFVGYHTDRYLLQCFYNLQEKYDRGQKDFSKEQYEQLEQFVKGAIS